MKGWLWTVWLTAFLVLVSCGNGELTVDDVWARPSPQGAPAAAFYLTIDNQSGQQDTLQEVQIDLCNAVELHRTSVDDDGMMRMAPVEGSQLSIPSREQVQLAPGGLHIMCIGLSEPLLEGQQVPLVLQFDVAGTITAEAQVRAGAP